MLPKRPVAPNNLEIKDAPQALQSEIKDAPQALPLDGLKP
ncbi:hypothetical protein JOD24_000120 [Kroppenstedtia sanguinis]